VLAARMLVAHVVLTWRDPILRIPLVTLRRARPIPCRQGWWPGDTRMNNMVRALVTNDQ